MRNEHVDCLAFVGGKTNGGVIASSLYDDRKRYMLEMEGVNAYGVWQYSDWPALAAQLRKGFDYGKQRCTAYVRFVVQRELFPQFLQMYLGVLQSLQYGNPVMVENESDPLAGARFRPAHQQQKSRGAAGAVHRSAWAKARSASSRARSPRTKCCPTRIFPRICRPRRS